MTEGVLEQIVERIEALEAGSRLYTEWYTLADCSRLKGVSEGYFRSNPWARPLGGAGSKRVAGRDRWSRKDVLRWLGQSDEELRKLYGGER